MKRVALVAAILMSACAKNPPPEGPAPQTPAVVETPRPQTSPAQTPPTPPPAAQTGAFDPLGTFIFAVDVGGNAAGGTITIVKAADGKLGGTVDSDQGSLTLSNVAVEGRKMTLNGMIPNGPNITFVLNFEGDKYTGTVTVETMSGTISGERKKS